MHDIQTLVRHVNAKDRSARGEYHEDLQDSRGDAQ